MTDSELTTKLEKYRAELIGHENDLIAKKHAIDFIKSQIKVFEKELKRREKWAEKTNGKQE